MGIFFKATSELVHLLNNIDDRDWVTLCNKSKKICFISATVDKELIGEVNWPSIEKVTKVSMSNMLRKSNNQIIILT